MLLIFDDMSIVLIFLKYFPTTKTKATNKPTDNKVKIARLRMFPPQTALVYVETSG